MKKICSSIFRVLVIPYVMCGFVAAQNSYTLNGLSELKEFTAGSVEETVENLTLIEPEGSEMIPESEILKLTDRENYGNVDDGRSFSIDYYNRVDRCDRL